MLLHILENEHPNVRVICTADPELRRMVSEKTFRPNLFYILRPVDITVPSLREVTEDIVPLSDYFLTHFAHSKEQHRRKLDASAIKALKLHPWPGNVRELKDTVLYAAFHSKTDLCFKARSVTTQNSVYQRKAILFGGLFRSESYSTELVCENCRILRKKRRWVETKNPR